MTPSDSHYSDSWWLGLRNDYVIKIDKYTCISHVDDLINLHNSLIIVLRWYELSLLLRYIEIIA